MTKEEIEYLKKKSYPKMYIKSIHIGGRYKADLILPVHGIELIILDNI